MKIKIANATPRQLQARHHHCVWPSRIRTATPSSTPQRLGCTPCGRWLRVPHQSQPACEVGGGMSIMQLPETSRRYAVWICQLEDEIIEQANYIMSTSIRHPVADIRSSKRAIELATARRLILDIRPEINQKILSEARQTLEKMK